MKLGMSKENDKFRFVYKRSKSHTKDVEVNIVLTDTSAVETGVVRMAIYVCVYKVCAHGIDFMSSIVKSNF